MASKSEKSYTQTGLLADPPTRADGRALGDYRSIALATGVAPLANGSARVVLGGTEVLAACRLDVEDVEDVDGADDGGRIVCAVSCAAAAYPHAAPAALDDLQHDLAHVLHGALAHAALRPPGLRVLPRRAAWRVALDCVVLADAGSVHDALFAAARAALCDTRVPRTRAVASRAPQREGAAMLDTRPGAAADFELVDAGSEGAPLAGRDRWPVCVTLNLLATRHFIDATPQEDAATPLRLLLVFAFPGAPVLHGMRLIGVGEVVPAHLAALIREGEKHAVALVKVLDAKMRAEESRRAR